MINNLNLIDSIENIKLGDGKTFLPCLIYSARNVGLKSEHCKDLAASMGLADKLDSKFNVLCSTYKFLLSTSYFYCVQMSIEILSVNKMAMNNRFFGPAQILEMQGFLCGPAVVFDMNEIKILQFDGKEYNIADLEEIVSKWNRQK